MEDITGGEERRREALSRWGPIAMEVGSGGVERMRDSIAMEVGSEKRRAGGEEERGRAKPSAGEGSSFVFFLFSQ